MPPLSPDYIYNTKMACHGLSNLALSIARAGHEAFIDASAIDARTRLVEGGYYGGAIAGLPEEHRETTPQALEGVLHDEQPQ